MDRLTHIGLPPELFTGYERFEMSSPRPDRVEWAIYNGDCMAVMPSLPDGSIHLSIYSPPFAGLYHYTTEEDVARLISAVEKAVEKAA